MAKIFTTVQQQVHIDRFRRVELMGDDTLMEDVNKLYRNVRCEIVTKGGSN